MITILLVEDDVALARGIEYALKKEGWSVHLATDFSQGITELHKASYDLVLLDVMLPDGSGFDLCEEIRKNSDIPVIFLTACDEEVNVVLGLDLGADDYITKPFRVRELISRIKANLRRVKVSEQLSKSVLVTRDITINLIEHSVYKGNNEIFLTPTEFKLLKTLVQNAGRVLTREQLLSKLWDLCGEFVDDNTLSVYIKRLRSKLEDDTAILTVRGVGYRWNSEGQKF